MVIYYTSNLKDYLKYIKKYYMVTNKTSLINLGDTIYWYLLYKDDEDQVYNLFTHVVNNVAGINIKD